MIGRFSVFYYPMRVRWVPFRTPRSGARREGCLWRGTFLVTGITSGSARGPKAVVTQSRCMLCDSERSRYVTTEKGFDIVECTTCSLLYVSPMPHLPRAVLPSRCQREHLHDPKGSLAENAHLLVPGQGTLVVLVPNMNFHKALRRSRFVAAPVLRLTGKQVPPFLGGIAPPEHRLGFTPRTLRTVLEQSGFECVRIQPGRTRDDSWGTGDSSSRNRATWRLSRAVSATTRMLHSWSRGSVAIMPTLEAWGTTPSELVG